MQLIFPYELYWYSIPFLGQRSLRARENSDFQKESIVLEMQHGINLETTNVRKGFLRYFSSIVGGFEAEIFSRASYPPTGYSKRIDSSGTESS